VAACGSRVPTWLHVAWGPNASFVHCSCRRSRTMGKKRKKRYYKPSFDVKERWPAYPTSCALSKLGLSDFQTLRVRVRLSKGVRVIKLMVKLK